MKLRHAMAAWADEEEASLARPVWVVITGDEQIPAVELVREAMRNEEAERAVNGRWRGIGFEHSDLVEQLIRFNPMRMPLQQHEHQSANRCMPVKHVRRFALFVAAWLCGLVTAFCGPVAFLGLVAAQVARGVLGSADHRLLLPGAVLVGAALGLAADLVTHLPWSRHVLHLNAVIGLVGAPVALFVLLRRQRSVTW